MQERINALGPHAGSGTGTRLAPAGEPGVPAMPQSYPSGGYTDLGQDSNALSVLIQQFIGIVLKHRWRIAGIVLFFLMLGVLYVFMKTPVYVANARIQIDREPMKVVEGGATTPIETNSVEFLRTQYELLKSRTIAERVVSMLSLDNDGNFTRANKLGSQTAASTQGPAGLRTQTTARATPQVRSKVIDHVADNISVRPVPASRLVDLSYKDPSPAQAQRIANAYAQAFVTANLDKRFEANAYAKTFLEDQIKQLRLKLEEADKALLEFVEREKIIEISEKAPLSEHRLGVANAALGQLVAERIKAEQLWRQIEGASTVNFPQMLTNGVIDGLRTRKNLLVTEYQEKLQTFKPSFPSMLEIKNKIEEVDRQLQFEIKTIAASLKAGYESALSQERTMQARIDGLQEEILAFQKKGNEHNILKREVATNQKIYNSLLERYKEVDVAGGSGSNNVLVVERAQVPDFPSEPRLGRSLLAALLLGFVVAIGVAYLTEMLDDRVRAPEDVEQLSGLPTLGVIPLVEGAELTDSFRDPRSHVMEAYRSLATALQFSTASGLPRTLSITSSGQGEGKSSAAVALARLYATMGLKVLIIDGDLRRPSLHSKFGLDNTSGLSNYLTGSAKPPDVIQATDLANLAFMSSGPIPPNAAELLAGTRLFSLISIALEVFDLVIIDSPPLLGLADAQILCGATQATVFVTGAGQYRKGMIRSALRRLQLARIVPLGVVLTKFDSKAVAYNYSYNYGYTDYSYTTARMDEVPSTTGDRQLTGTAAS